MRGQRITLTRRQFQALLSGRSPEPMEMARKRTEKPAEINRAWAQLSEEELTPQLTKAFDEAAKSGMCMCGCGEKAAKDGRGLAAKCSNQFKGNKIMIHNDLGKEAADDWDREQQKLLKVLPPGWGREKNQFAQSRKAFIAARKKPDRKAVKS